MHGDYRQISCLDFLLAVGQHPNDVIKLFFGMDYLSDQDIENDRKSGSGSGTMNRGRSFWKGGIYGKERG
jgi:hypothetical protein